MTLKAKLDKFAADLVTECLQNGAKPVPLQEKLDCFKAVAAYYAILAKHKGDTPPPVEGDTFDSFRETLHREEQANGGGTRALQSRRRRDAAGGGEQASIGGPHPRPV